jgi:hypothetical protein
MRAIFKTGPLEGRAFEVPNPPPKGLDVQHGDRVLRYGFEGFDEVDGAVFVFCEARRTSTWKSHPVWLGENVQGVALLFYPARRQQPGAEFS